MGARVLAKSEWAPYFSRLHRVVQGRGIKIEVVGAALGDQVLLESAALLGATYEPRQDTLEISVKGITHVINEPRKISIQMGNGDVSAIEVVDSAERQQILIFA
ncbi:DUF5335 family protein [Rhizobium sp. P32RR-XVIII]|uniref:DUF5335 family protein n=1 Tax=Rhizobium sp. P32RR-XVIII TaxID=2726738 RepID=UPI001456EDB4|nr:DUF5335 family protein [Rhizobium sp. P32RR-XVIII]NLS08249.1 DUF5335 family protein [Rhizobium sp. P32RR-XVIII]